jgi:Integrase core domain
MQSKNGSLTPELEKKLRDTYYDISHSAGFSSITKLATHVGTSKENVKEWLRGQEAYSLHKPIRRNFKRNRYFVPSFGYQFESDLADFSSIASENDGFKFLLVVIDVFSKVAQVEPMKNKSGKTTAEALKKILKRMGPAIIFRTDRGLEYGNLNVAKILAQENIKHVVTDNEEVKCACAERLIRTIKTKIYKYFTHFGKQRYVDIIQKVIESYNNTIHSAIGRKPKDVNSDNLREVFEYLYGGKGRYKKLKMFPKEKPKFKIGDHVKISESKLHFAKGYQPNFSHEYFVISKVILRVPTVYRLKDSFGEEITGTWYETELQSIKIEGSTEFRIDTIIKTQGKGRTRKLYVKWKGYPEKFNSWILEKDLVNL